MYRSRRIAAVVLARTGSHRLPGKMLLPFGGGTVLTTTIRRLQASALMDDLIVATTDSPEDDELAEAVGRLGIQVVRGSENDVVTRMCQAIDALRMKPDIVIRACADNPLVMPTLVDDGVCELIDSCSDLVTPFEHPTLPFGYGLVSMTRRCLERIDARATDAIYREHVENYCFENPESFRIHYQVAPRALEFAELRLTLDYPVDYQRLLRCERLVRGVKFREQPRLLIERVRSARVWLEGVSTAEPKGYDLVVATEEPRDTGNPALGIVVVDVIERDGQERFALRYTSSSGPGFPSDPIFVDRRKRRAGDSPASFLAYALPLVVSSLQAGPMRAADMQELFTPPKAKHVDWAGRRGFHAPDDLNFPPCVAIERSVSRGAADLLDRVMGELDGRPEAKLIFAENENELRVSLAVERLGSARVTKATSTSDLFHVVSVDADGNLHAGPEEVPYGEVTVESFWRSTAVRRARATFLNGEAA